MNKQTLFTAVRWVIAIVVVALFAQYQVSQHENLRVVQAALVVTAHNMWELMVGLARFLAIGVTILAAITGLYVIVEQELDKRRN